MALFIPHGCPEIAGSFETLKEFKERLLAENFHRKLRTLEATPWATTGAPAVFAVFIGMGGQDRNIGPDILDDRLGNPGSRGVRFDATDGCPLNVEVENHGGVG